MVLIFKKFWINSIKLKTKKFKQRRILYKKSIGIYKSQVNMESEKIKKTKTKTTNMSPFHLQIGVWVDIPSVAIRNYFDIGVVAPWKTTLITRLSISAKGNGPFLSDLI